MKIAGLRKGFVCTLVMIMFLSLLPVLGGPVYADAGSAPTLLQGGIANEQNVNAGIVNLSNGGHAVLTLHQVAGDLLMDGFTLKEGKVSVYDAGNNLILSTELAEGDDQHYVNSASIAKLANGGFVVAWTGMDSTFVIHPYYQIFDNAGNTVGSFHSLSDETPSWGAKNIQVIGRSNGGFAVVFSNDNSQDILVTYSYNSGSFTKLNESTTNNPNSNHTTNTPTETGATLQISSPHPKVIELSDGSMIVEDSTYVHVTSTYTPLGDFVYKFDNAGVPANFANGFPMMRINWMTGGDAAKGFELIALSGGGFATINSN
ncbi:MAG: hypothetical protein J7559_13200, partial [Cohnella sp.]|nr:hypothetical protein [Cohnella sp.]